MSSASDFAQNELLDGIVAAHTAENGPNQGTVKVSLKENFKSGM